ncbi:MAG: right-handed parallel beta-helix repeat-containing protein [Bacteroidetes bacterium]|nr:right-handed parallel beta-helix repeat-containing protein [Bacteroidota bacterium]
MKNKNSKHAFPFVLSLIFILFYQMMLATNYYVHPVLGDDQNAGISIVSPFRSLEKVSTLDFEPGDKLLLAAGHTFYGSLILKNIRGSTDNPIEISSYCWGNALEDKRAAVDAKGYLNAVLLENCSHLLLQNLILTANGGDVINGKKKGANMRCGVLITTTEAGEYANITLQNLLVRDIFFEEKGFQRGKDEVRTANGIQSYGWGIRFINRTKDAVLKDMNVFSCEVKNVAHTGIKFTGGNHSIQNIRVYENRILETGGPGIQMSGISKGHIKGNYVKKSGSTNDSRKWGRGSGLWTWGSLDVIIEKNHFMNANGPADSAGCHIDFNCKNVVVQYNFSAYNAGGFCEILGNNHNCAYRYNISVNDGHRVKGEKGAFQEGKIFWLSGYVGRKKERHGPYNSYFYNNTIYVREDILSKVAVTKTAAGVLVANNIFYIEGESKAVLGDQYNPEKKGSGDVKSVIFQNNLFLKTDYWPKEVLIQPTAMVEGDAQFFHKSGLTITDYIPGNKTLVKDKGIEIPRLPADTIGLIIGLKATHDILGNPILGKPDIGAIEVD